MGAENWTNRLNNSHFGFFSQFFSPHPALLLPILQYLVHTDFSPLPNQGLTFRYICAVEMLQCRAEL